MAFTPEHYVRNLSRQGTLPESELLTCVSSGGASDPHFCVSASATSFALHILKPGALGWQPQGSYILDRTKSEDVSMASLWLNEDVTAGGALGAAAGRIKLDGVRTVTLHLFTQPSETAAYEDWFELARYELGRSDLLTAPGGDVCFLVPCAEPFPENVTIHAFEAELTFSDGRTESWYFPEHMESILRTVRDLAS
ncbi:MAG: hypothetical protein IJ484_08780 [Oscillospiraceae bacterium]|nr:hypothetical protein [Oscillospiraceae bacterium]